MGGTEYLEGYESRNIVTTKKKIAKRKLIHLEISKY